MAENTKIEWAVHTFNPWIGCTKVGPGCDHCYAADLSAVRLKVPWGAGQPRRRTAASTWRQPRRWNRRAVTEGRRYRIFCASLADVFDNEVPAEWRADLFALIRDTPQLDWLLVTKRIGNADRMAQAAGGWPANVWLGATIVNQEEADRDLPKLRAIEEVRYRFLSMEPLLEEVAFDPCDLAALDWIIVGGESGPGARPMHPQWARSLRDQCAIAGVYFLFKQWGEWAPVSAINENEVPDEDLYHRRLARHQPEGPRRCKVAQCVMQSSGRTFPVNEWSAISGENPGAGDFAYAAGSGAMMFMAIGKGRAGRKLDGLTYDGVPV